MVTGRSAAAWLVVVIVLVALAAGLAGAPFPAPVVRAAQDDQGGAELPCVADTEPNDTPDTAMPLAGAACVGGTMVEGDQDLFLWTLSDEDVSSRWTISLVGIPATETILQIMRVTSPPEETTLQLSDRFIELTVGPGEHEVPAVQPDTLFLPGRYVIAVARSAVAPGMTASTDAYTLTLAPGTPVPPTGDVEPNDDPETATTVQGAFALSGDLQNSSDVYAWTVDETDASKGWELRAQGAAGESLTIELRNSEGTSLVWSSARRDGRITLYDLGFAPGTYILTVNPAAMESRPYILEMVETGDRPEGDVEPNDEIASAAPFDVTRPIKGRLTPENDKDIYRLTVDAELTGVMIDVKLVWRSGRARQLCLVNAEGTDLQCRRGETGVSLTDMYLSAGDHYLEVSGDPDLDDLYILRVDTTTPPAAGFETEPNDDVTVANTLPIDEEIRGHLNGQEEDLFRLSVDGEPQLWDVVLDGQGLSRLTLVDAGGRQVHTVDATDGTHAQISDLYLTPGDHWLAVIGTDGDYTLRATPTGPPTPDREREPNNAPADAHPISLGEVRVGRLVEANDRDLYRFFLAAEEHLIIRVIPPPDGDIGFTLNWGALSVARVVASGLGTQIDYETILPPGDYTLDLAPVVTSSDFYQVVILREDPLTVPADLEPNQSPEQARPLPPSFTVRGATSFTLDYGDADWYRLPDLTEPATMTVRVVGDVMVNLVQVGGGNITLTPAETPGVYTAELPAEVPLAFGVTTAGTYELAFSFEPGPSAQPDPQPLPVTLALTPETDSVAAYWFEGQRLAADLAITNTGSAPLTLALDAVTSHYAWQVELSQTEVTVAPGNTAVVPVTLHIAPDAWADRPVRLTARVRAPDGAQQTVGVDITPRRDAPPIRPAPVWSVPDSLLGGLDVAALALGAQPAGTIDPESEARLHDGIAPAGGGFAEALPSDFPIELTVDLAGDDPLPIVGVVLNPLAGSAAYNEIVRDFEILLSEDGQNYSVVYAGELRPLFIDQAFAFESPVPARFARLRILSTWSDRPFRLALGEWKVIAQPGVVPDSIAEINLADPALGGHVVVMDPLPLDFNAVPKLVGPEPDRLTVDLPEGAIPSWIIGFHDDRAAQLVELHWVDPPDSADVAGADGTAENRFHAVDVEISTDSPAGPWQRVGTWTLERAPDGTVAPFVFAEPTWARFVRFIGHGPQEEVRGWEYPAQILAIERPTDDTYRSILGEWGQTSRVAIYEALTASENGVTAELSDEDDAGETADQARLVSVGETVHGRAQIERDVDWYRVEVPADRNRLTLTLSGAPTLGVILTLYDETGAEVPISVSDFDDPRQLTYTLEVEPGATYFLRVEQPPHSVVFTFDTSGSIGAYEPYVRAAMRTFVAGVVPEHEAVNLLPFEDDFLLDEWGATPEELQAALNAFAYSSSSSGGEKALLDAASGLAGRPGAKAILIITDGETSSKQVAPEMWAVLSVVQPRIFAVQIGAEADPVSSQDIMQDWATVGDGTYQYSLTQGEIDRAFDRTATYLRRPADYTLTVEATFEAPTPTPRPTATPEPTATPTPTVTPSPTPTPTPTPAEPPRPGSIQVLSPRVEEGEQPVVVPAAGTAIEIILDTSGSMLQEIEPGRTRADVAKEVLTDLVLNRIPVGAPVALRTFGNVPDSCETNLAVPLQPLDPQAMVQTIANLPVVNLVRTPIGASLEMVTEDLRDAPGPKIVVLVTDGEETCDGDPEAAIRALRRQGIDVHVNIVGFALDDDALRDQFRRWARLGGGTYFDATNTEELGTAISRAVQAPFRVLNEDGEVVATGTVDGNAVSVPPGVYTVEVLTDPRQTFEDVEVVSGERTRLRLRREE